MVQGLIYKAKESEAEIAEDRKTEDLSNATKLFAFLGVSVNIVRTTRLGKISEDGPRPWKIQLDSTKGPNNILKNANKLKNHDQFGTWSLTPDYTQSQREERRLLVSELNARKAKGEKDIGIRQNRIVQIKRKAESATSDSFPEDTS